MSESFERHSMKGWGLRYGDLAEPRSRDEAHFTAVLAQTDLLREILTSLQDIQLRMTRIEVWIEENAPGYTRTSAYQQARPSDYIQLPARHPSTGVRP